MTIDGATSPECRLRATFRRRVRANRRRALENVLLMRERLTAFSHSASGEFLMSTGGLAPHTPRLQTLVVRAVIRACTMGLLPERAGYAISGREDAVEALVNILDAARSAGIARGITVPVD